jgi:hypothetical protein
MDEAASTEKPEYDGDKLHKEGQKWLQRIRAAETREKDWRDDAAAAEKAYAADTKSDHGCLYDFNILHSNVETIVPAIYNSTPVPDVRRRFIEATGEPPQDPTPGILMQAAQQMGMSPEQAQQAMQAPQGQQVAQRVLAAPQARQALAGFQKAMQAYQAAKQRDADAKSYGDMIESAITVQIDDNKLDKEVERAAQDAFLAGRAVGPRVKFEAIFGDGDQVSGERLEYEAVSWRDFRMGPATRWPNVPWIAFRHVVSREAAEGYTDKEVYDAQAAQFPTIGVEEEDDIAFWEVWCKTTKQVKFIREHDGRVMKLEDDPLGLTGFFPIPEPVQPITLTGKMTPVCPFTIYKKLADELDTNTKRINHIMKGLKVRGIVIGAASKIVDLSTANDNELVVDSDLEGLAQIGLDKAVLWWPVEQAVRALTQLYAQREVIKASIYEITGFSDIVRGASEGGVKSATEQEIKTRWGALRIQKMQRMIERLVRDVFAISAEIISTKFSPQTLFLMTGIEVTEGMQVLMQEPVLTSYRVNVESDSTVRADLTRQKQDMAEFVNGTANYFKTMGPMMAQAPDAAEPIIEMYRAMASVFNLGRAGEEALEKLVDAARKAAKQPRPNPEAEAAKAEAEAKARDREAAIAEKDRDFKMKEAAAASAERREAAKEQRQIAYEERLFALKERAAGLDVRLRESELAFKERQQEIALKGKVVAQAIKLDGQQKDAARKAQPAR